VEEIAKCHAGEVFTRLETDIVACPIIARDATVKQLEPVEMPHIEVLPGRLNANEHRAVRGQL
jgi:hypothetical protein